jgi:hypothetical protein
VAEMTELKAITIPIKGTKGDKKVVRARFEKEIAMVANNHLCDLDCESISKITSVFLKEHYDELFIYNSKLVVFPKHRLEGWFCYKKHCGSKYF